MYWIRISDYADSRWCWANPFEFGSVKRCSLSETVLHLKMKNRLRKTASLCIYLHTVCIQCTYVHHYQSRYNTVQYVCIIHWQQLLHLCTYVCVCIQMYIQYTCTYAYKVRHIHTWCDTDREVKVCIYIRTSKYIRTVHMCTHNMRCTLQLLRCNTTCVICKCTVYFIKIAADPFKRWRSVM